MMRTMAFFCCWNDPHSLSWYNLWPMTQLNVNQNTIYKHYNGGHSTQWTYDTKQCTAKVWGGRNDECEFWTSKLVRVIDQCQHQWRLHTQLILNRENVEYISVLSNLPPKIASYAIIQQQQQHTMCQCVLLCMFNCIHVCLGGWHFRHMANLTACVCVCVVQVVLMSNYTHHTPLALCALHYRHFRFT